MARNAIFGSSASRPDGAAKVTNKGLAPDDWALAVRPLEPFDSFGRLRVSNPTTIFDSKQIFDKQPFFWDDQETTGSDVTDSTFSAARASTIIAVDASEEAARTRQTFQRFNYQPGKSLLIIMTFRLTAAPATGITTEIGYCDSNNGILLHFIEGTANVTVRSKVSGSVVDTSVAQSDWNIDPMDGTGPSGHTLDFTNTHILAMDLEWLGVGTVRFGFFVNGEFCPAHYAHHTNQLTAVYMSTPNLPLRYKVANDGTGSAAGLEHICSTVMSEGGMQDTGILHSHSTGATAISCDAGSTYALIGLRLKAAQVGQDVKIEHINVMVTTGDDFEWKLIWNPTVAGTFTYGDVPNASTQTVTGTASNTITNGTVITRGHVLAAGGGNTVDFDVSNALRIGAAIDGTLDQIVLAIEPKTNGAGTFASMTWREAT